MCDNLLNFSLIVRVQSMEVEAFAAMNKSQVW